MKMNWLSSAFMAFILVACLSGANGAEPVALSGYQGAKISDFTNAALYSEFYGSMMGAAPTSILTAPEQVDLAGKAPSTVYFGTEMQKVAYSTYQPAASGNAIWLAGATSWSQYAKVPQGSVVNLLAVSTAEGQGTFVVYHPTGQRFEYNYFIFPASQLKLFADAPGRYQVSYIINGAPSNTVYIDAEGTTTSSAAGTGYWSAPVNTDYLGSIFGTPKVSTGPQAGLDNKNAMKEYQKLVNSQYWSGSDNDIAWAVAMDKWLNAA